MTISSSPSHLLVWANSRSNACAPAATRPWSGRNHVYLLDRIEHDSRITVHTQTVVASVHGDRQLESVVIEDRLSGEDTEVLTHDLFVMIGAEPHTPWLEDTVLRDRRGFIPTGDEISAAVLSYNDWATQGRGPYLLETSLPGVFAVGDVRANSIKRVAAAVGEGSMAVRFRPVVPRTAQIMNRRQRISSHATTSATRLLSAATTSSAD